MLEAFRLLNVSAVEIWHADRFCYKEYTGFVLPGGFSYGDYLRAGALATQSPALQDLYTAVQAGWPVLGICNGFQILCEAGLLEGTLQLNLSSRFVNQWVDLELGCSGFYWNSEQKFKPSIRLPIAHKEGRFYVNDRQLKCLQDEGRIWWRYINNPNGSVDHIAGIFSKNKRIAGLMPHPERAITNWMGGTDGLLFFQNL